MHLGMSGVVLPRAVVRDARREITSPPAPPAPMITSSSRCPSGAAVIFTDPRRFGAMDSPWRPRPRHARDVVGARARAARPRVQRRCPLAQALARRKHLVEGRRSSDQRVVSGLGNIYGARRCTGPACRRNARRQHSSPGRARLVRPASARPGRAIRAALERRDLGSQSRPDGAGPVPCLRPRRANPVRGAAAPARSRRIVQAGRSTFFCPVCQG